MLATLPYFPTNEHLITKFFHDKQRNEGRAEAYITENSVVDCVLGHRQPSTLVPSELMPPLATTVPDVPFIPAPHAAQEPIDNEYVKNCKLGIDRIDENNVDKRKVRCGECREFYFNPKTHPYIMEGNQPFRYCAWVHRDLNQWKAEVLPIKKAQAHARKNPDTHCKQCFLPFDNGEHKRLDKRVNVYWCAKRSNLPFDEYTAKHGAFLVAGQLSHKEKSGTKKAPSTEKLSPQCSSEKSKRNQHDKDEDKADKRAKFVII